MEVVDEWWREVDP
jgi:hypothetical protein